MPSPQLHPPLPRGPLQLEAGPGRFEGKGQVPVRVTPSIPEKHILITPGKGVRGCVQRFGHEIEMQARSLPQVQSTANATTIKCCAFEMVGIALRLRRWQPVIGTSYEARGVPSWTRPMDLPVSPGTGRTVQIMLPRAQKAHFVTRTAKRMVKEAHAMP